MKTAVVVNLSKQEAISCAREISILMLSNNAQIYMLSECMPYFKGIQISYFDTNELLFENCDIAITVGGDGTIIHSAKYAAFYDKPLIGVNVGRLGFAADVEPDEINNLNNGTISIYSKEKTNLNKSKTSFNLFFKLFS